MPTLRPIKVYEIKSPCKNCPEVTNRCRHRCKKLRDFLRWLDENPSVAFGVINMDSDYPVILK